MAKNTIEKKEITKKDIDQVFVELRRRFDEKIKRKGNFGFSDRHSAYGHLEEEVNELLWELHENDHKGFIEEQYDVAIVSLVSLISFS